MKKSYIESIKPKLPERIRALSPGDMHLGKKAARVSAFIEILDRPECDNLEMLIEMGDFFDKKNTKNLPDKHMKLLEKIAEMQRKGMRFIALRGNHDPNIDELLERFHPIKDVPVYSEYMFEAGGKIYLFIHGDIFDKLLKYVPKFIGEAATWLHDYLQKFDKKNFSLAAFLKRHTKIAFKVAELVAHDGAIYAFAKGADGFASGHTHIIDQKKIRIGDKKIRFYNVGSFQERESGLFTIDFDGRARIHRVITRMEEE
ncbi:metallophosphoesterase [bacterium]|nr:metallophosphoesterase [bacterium]